MICVGSSSILLVEDSADIMEIVSLHLTNAGYQVLGASHYSEALNLLKKQHFDLIILDILLPDSTGFELCGKIREAIYCPIIFMSCLDSEESIAKALELGGDDYITKPVRPKEIVARVKANLRRVKQYADLQKSNGNTIEFGGLTLDLGKHIVSSSKGITSITPLEFSILVYLLQSTGRMITYSELFENVWKTQSFDDHRTVKVHVSNLKNKLRRIETEQNLIVNIRGEGYMLKI